MLTSSMIGYIKANPDTYLLIGELLLGAERSYCPAFLIEDLGTVTGY